MTVAEKISVWGDYPNYQDMARLEYARVLWKNPAARKRLLAHWTNEQHPHAGRFEANRDLLEEVLASDVTEQEMEKSLRLRNWSLRTLAREIPPVFGDFY